MPLKRLSETEAAYLAGIIDGEGTVTLTRTHRGENRRPVVSISSTELPLLLYVRSVIGAGRITGKVRAQNGRYTSRQRAARQAFEQRFFAKSVRAKAPIRQP